MYVDIFPHEAANERPHVHISKNPKHKGPGSLKVWLDTLQLDDNSSLTGFTVRELRETMAFVKKNKKLMREHYAFLHEAASR